MKKGIMVALIIYAVSLATPLFLLTTIPSAQVDMALNSPGIFMQSVSDCGSFECFNEPTIFGHMINLLVVMFACVLIRVIFKNKFSIKK